MDHAAHDPGANGSGIGQPVRRREDLRLVRGAGRYTADENLPDQAYAVMVRSPHAHARLRGIDTAAAKATPGVLAVLTGADFLADGPGRFRTSRGRRIRRRPSFTTVTAPHPSKRRTSRC